MKIAVVVPFYNESKNLKFFMNEWNKYLRIFDKMKIKLDFFFFDDGSSDDSTEIIKKKSKKIKFQIIHKKNSGHGDTCRYGYNLIIKKYKYFDYILQIDSDNQCDPKYLIKICQIINKKNYEFIFGYRSRRQDGFVRIILSRILSLTIF